MTFPVAIEANNGSFVASVVGSPAVQAEASTRAAALIALESTVQKQVELGHLANIKLNVYGVSALAGLFRDDPDLRDIIAEAYAARDAERFE